jgi:hypothetical protein
MFVFESFVIQTKGQSRVRIYQYIIPIIAQLKSKAIPYEKLLYNEYIA